MMNIDFKPEEFETLKNEALRQGLKPHAFIRKVMRDYIKTSTDKGKQHNEGTEFYKSV